MLLWPGALRAMDHVGFDPDIVTKKAWAARLATRLRSRRRLSSSIERQAPTERRFLTEADPDSLALPFGSDSERCDGWSTEAARSARRKRGHKPREEFVDYIVTIDGWEWSYLLSLSNGRRAADPYHEFRHL
ncbi:hypothetical protein [Bradyrhizobium sp. CCBAU 53421]|uniref:hypothetical protein n=1 Tax=Bradyrhizobium sp. CCBAU 53421 TaxID=1325120 RepID=UPI0018BFB232|nr:hypothetical protein [Bradyrhizobium sp. CCBAU 53421]QOZ36584.1 hypothetical protein XH92_37520 [Bradyrhizobium sp. CCBAU 53421]